MGLARSTNPASKSVTRAWAGRPTASKARPSRSSSRVVTKRSTGSRAKSRSTGCGSCPPPRWSIRYWSTSRKRMRPAAWATSARAGEGSRPVSPKWRAMPAASSAADGHARHRLGQIRADEEGQALAFGLRQEMGEDNRIHRSAPNGVRGWFYDEVKRAVGKAIHPTLKGMGLQHATPRQTGLERTKSLAYAGVAVVAPSAFRAVRGVFQFISLHVDSGLIQQQLLHVFVPLRGS